MHRSRRYRQRWILVPALILSAAVEAGGVATYDATRPPPTWTLTVDLPGEGAGQVIVTRAGAPQPLLRCTTRRCRVELELGAQLQLIAIPAEGSTFGGWSQRPMRTPPALRPLLGDPLAGCTDDGQADLIDYASAKNPLECPITISADIKVEADFGLVPEEQDVALLDTPNMPPNIALPEAMRVPPAPLEAEKLDDEAIPFAAAPPPPPPPIEVLPPPPQDKQDPAQPPPANMTMVELNDDHQVDKAPDDATHLSDKNRDVAEETRATDTNLDKELKGTSRASAESDDTTSPDVGGPDERVAHIEETKSSIDEPHAPTNHAGESDHDEGEKVGEQGDNGHDGTGPKDPGILSMREIGGRGSIVDQGDGRAKGREGSPGLHTQLAFNDYERIVGKDKSDAERDLGAARLSAHKGRWERKLQAIQSALENFTPDVRPGNQTALKTKANPFAVYIARMHRKIHERWGFGFLEDLDDKPASSPMNNFDLYVVIELSVNPDGTVHKTTIAKTSGVLEFDVAALDTVLSSGPYDETPETIRSVDQRVYMRWGFYRNWRQCGTFNVEPYILTDIPGGIEPIDDGAMIANVAGHGKPVTPASSMESERASPTSSVSDEKALYAANLWVSGFAQANVEKMARFSAVPFSAGGQVAAQSKKDLEDMYKGLLVESGPLRDWKLMTAAEYGAAAAGDALVLQVRTSKETFAVVLQRTPSGDFRATQLVR